MTTPSRCPTCGADVPPDAPAGTCPACLLAAGLDPPPPPLPPEEVGRRLPAFDVEGVIGRGGMGVVYAARQRALDRPVALKVLAPEIAGAPGFAERFLREARALARLSHPNIVAVHDAGEVDGLCYLAMERVDGVNLRQAQAAGRLPPEQALRIVPQICDALQYAHDHGVVHRDVKPENILIDRAGRVKIADFGLAKLLGRAPVVPTLTGTQQVLGTFHYLAPEQIRSPRDVDHRADIYALGVVFYEMLTGELPIGRFPAPSERVQVDVRLDEVVLKALERERERRWQRAEEVKTGVEVVTSGTPAASPAPAGAAGRGSPLAATRVTPWAVASVLCWPAALLTALLVGGLGYRDEVGAWAAAAVLGIGMLFATIAWHDVRDHPDRRHGRRLARWGFTVPVVAGVLAALVIAVLAIANRPARQGRQAEQVRLQVAASARALLRRLARLPGGMAPLDAYADLYAPDARAPLLELPDDAWRRRFQAAALGLAFVPPEAFAGPLSAYEVASVELPSPPWDHAWVRIALANETVRFEMVRDEDLEWWLAEGAVTWEPPLSEDRRTSAFQTPHEPRFRERSQARGEVDALFLALPTTPDPDDLDVILPAVDPRERDRLRMMSSDERRRLRDQDVLGFAFFDRTRLPQGSSISSSPETLHLEGDHGTYVGTQGSYRVEFPIVRVDGRWYLGVGRVVHHDTR